MNSNYYVAFIDILGFKGVVNAKILISVPGAFSLTLLKGKAPGTITIS